MARRSSGLVETKREAIPLDRRPEDLARLGKLTPMLRQYLEIKRKHEDCVLFFRLGDFYECFFQDAVRASELLDITLTARGKGEDRFPMAGIPHHAARGYIAKLVEAGFKVALADQVEEAQAAKGLVRREVVQIVTPGMVLDESLLERRGERLLGTFVPEDEGGALALLELSTGHLRATRLQSRASVLEEIARCDARELLVDPETPVALRAQIEAVLAQGKLTVGEPDLFEARPARRMLQLHFGVQSLAFFGVPEGKAGQGLCCAAAAALRYAKKTQKQSPVHVDRLQVYSVGEGMILDASSRAHLEVVRTLHEGRRKGSLLDLIDRSKTAAGGRTLASWLLRPCSTLESIEARHESVQHLLEAGETRRQLLELLSQIADLERLLGRLCLGHGTPRDLKALERSLLTLPELIEQLGSQPRPALIKRLSKELVGFEGLASTLKLALQEEPPPTLREGGIFRRGYKAELDELIALAEDGKSWLLELEARERIRTGIGSLKVRYNRVFGYYLEVTRANSDKVPSDYVRRQTMKGAERYVTPELETYEAKVLTASERRRALEMELFEALRQKIVEQASPIRQLAQALATLDALLGLAQTASELGWVRPEMDESRDLVLEGGRHPIIEEALRRAGGEPFVPCDLSLDEDHTLMVITGPNMAGKSTVMRQTALIVLLAQAGSFVPAKRARLGIVDRIFTRVGASDDLARGQSTFMVEMTQTAAILHSATDRSLVVLDEIGRGTSTFDGLSIAWSVAEHLHDLLRCRTLFATHFHELADLARERPRVFNATMAVKEWNERVIFLRSLVPGAASRSYGIQVARLAGLPQTVLDRATLLLARLEASELDPMGRAAFAHDAESAQDPGQLTLFSGARPKGPERERDPATAAMPAKANAEELDVLRRLRELDPDGLSPREAHALLYELTQGLDPGPK